MSRKETGGNCPQERTDNAAAAEIDLREIWERIRVRRKIMLWTLLASTVLGAVVAWSIPREYTSRVVVATEHFAPGSSGGLTALASMAGVNITQPGQQSETLTPDVYPDIVGSTPFLLDMLRMTVRTENGRDLSLERYINEHLRKPWWRGDSSTPGAPEGPSSGALLSVTEEPYRELNRWERAAIGMLRDRIDVSTDRKTGITRLSVEMQDHFVATQAADSLLSKLKRYITDYRTDKARKDLAFTEMLFAAAREDYHQAQSRYAHYADRNHNVVLQSYRTEQERLANEMNIAFAVYNQTAQQLALSKGKVQESTPVFTVLEPAMIPPGPSAPDRRLILAGFMLLGLFVALVYAVFTPVRSELAENYGQTGGNDLSID